MEKRPKREAEWTAMGREEVPVQIDSISGTKVTLVAKALTPVSTLYDEVVKVAGSRPGAKLQILAGAVPVQRQGKFVGDYLAPPPEGPVQLTFLYTRGLNCNRTNRQNELVCQSFNIEKLRQMGYAHCKDCGNQFLPACLHCDVPLTMGRDSQWICRKGCEIVEDQS